MLEPPSRVTLTTKGSKFELYVVLEGEIMSIPEKNGWPATDPQAITLTISDATTHNRTQWAGTFLLKRPTKAKICKNPLFNTPWNRLFLNKNSTIVKAGYRENSKEFSWA